MRTPRRGPYTSQGADAFQGRDIKIRPRHQTTPSRGGPRKGVADGGANLEDQSPPSDRYGDSPIRFHLRPDSK
jgi:hypothetical protein